MSTSYSIGQMNQLADALEKVGFTPDDVTRMRANPEAIKQFLLVIRGLSKIIPTDHFIDCDADPFIPDSLSVENHIRGGQFNLSSESLGLFLTKEQEYDDNIVGHDLRRQLKGKPVLNACVLDYLFVHPYFIPERWKNGSVFFWGTIYRRQNDILFVRKLSWTGFGWSQGYKSLDRGFSVHSFIAVCAI